eukprot:751957-Hanusia_phi.AAC.3
MHELTDGDDDRRDAWDPDEDADHVPPPPDPNRPRQDSLCLFSTASPPPPPPPFPPLYLSLLPPHLLTSSLPCSCSSLLPYVMCQGRWGHSKAADSVWRGTDLFSPWKEVSSSLPPLPLLLT